MTGNVRDRQRAVGPEPEMLVRESAVPLYEQVKRRLVEEIEGGALPPHGRVPSERRLVRDLGVSRITVRKVLGDLVHAGYLYAVPGKGFFVGPAGERYALNALLSFSAAARSRGVAPGSRVLAAEIVPATPWLVLQLRLPAAAEVVSLRRRASLTTRQR